MYNILLVEDDQNLSGVLSDLLILKGYAVISSNNGIAALELCMDKNFDLLLVDIMMPEMDGITFVKKLRADNNNTPVIFLTAKSQTGDRIEGFRAGADDYVTKPFSSEELMLRINAVIRRSAAKQEGNTESYLFTLGSYQFYPEKSILTFEGSEKKLTNKESQLLKLLCLSEGGLLNRSYALREIWGADNYFTSRSMDVYIVKLRNYLRSDPKVEIVNVHGVGYKLTGIAR